MGSSCYGGGIVNAHLISRLRRSLGAFQSLLRLERLQLLKLVQLSNGRTAKSAIFDIAQVKSCMYSRQGARKVAGGEARLCEREPPDQSHNVIPTRPHAGGMREAFSLPVLTLEFAHPLQHIVKYHIPPSGEKCPHVIARAKAKWSAPREARRRQSPVRRSAIPTRPAPPQPSFRKVSAHTVCGS